MVSLSLWVIGSLKEIYWREAEKEYLKRLSPYAKVDIKEFPDFPSKEGASKKEEEAVKSKEGEKLLSKLRPNDFVVLLDLGKNQYDSIAFSNLLADWERRGNSHIVFLIGGSLGLSEELRKRGNASFSLSTLTFTHQMTRIVLLEQLYRAYKIRNNEPYHK